MPRVMLPEGNFEAGDKVTLCGETAFHLACVLRLREGEEVTLVLPDGFSARAEVCSVSGGKKDPAVTVEVREVEKSDLESPLFIRVFQGVPKGKKTDLILQKCTELGASEITFVTLDRSVPEGKREKAERYEKICLSAAEQCGRSRRVKVSFLDGVEEAIAEMKKSEVYFACYEEEKAASPAPYLQKESKTLAFLVGPEGGISRREAELLSREGVPAVTLGRRILRTETAAPAVLSMLLYEKEL